MTVWAGVRDYALRVTSDTPTFLALVTGMAQRPFAEQSPFLAQQVATQHATPYMQAVAFLWSFLGGGERDPVSAARLLGLVGIPVFALLLWSVFLYARRVAGSRAAWISLPVLLGLFGPPHVIWASDQSLHGALYASYFPQNLAMATLLLTLLALERDGYPMLVLACLGAATTMLVHPFSGVLLCTLATVQGCYAALRREPGYYRAPVALIAGFALGMTWPAYSLDRAFAETGMPGVLFVSVCAGLVFAVHRLARVKRPDYAPRALSGLLERLTTSSAAFRLAIVGAVGTAIVVVWELALVHSPPEESARLAIYWVDDRWRWPLLLIAGTVGLSGLAWLARRGSIVPAFWLAGCLALGLLGVVGLPIPVWYRFLLLCQIPLAIGVAAVLAQVGTHANARDRPGDIRSHDRRQGGDALRGSAERELLRQRAAIGVEARRARSAGARPRRDGSQDLVLHPRGNRPPRAHAGQGARELAPRARVRRGRLPASAALLRGWSRLVAGGPGDVATRSSLRHRREAHDASARAASRTSPGSRRSFAPTRSAAA